MSGAGNHIVQKAHLKLKVGHEKHAYAVQSQVIALFQQQGIPALERELDRLAPTDQVIVLDRLELDLGSIGWEELQRKLPELLESKMREALGRVIHSNAGDAQVKRKDTDLGDLEALVRFLETGTLGWTVDQVDKTPEKLLQRLLVRQPDALRMALQQRLGNLRIVERLGQQFSPGSLRRVLGLFKGNGGHDPGLLLDDLLGRLQGVAGVLASLPQKAAKQLALVAGWILSRMAVAGPVEWAPDKAFQHMLQDHLEGGRISAPAMEVELGRLDLPALMKVLGWLDDGLGRRMATLQPGNLDSHVQQRMTDLLQTFSLQWLDEKTWIADASQLHRHIIATTPETASHERAIILKALGLEEMGKGGPRRKKVDATSEADQTKPRKRRGNEESMQPARKKAPSESSSLRIPVDEEAIYVDNAGLVLLNPFFQPCFEDLGWMKGGEFLNDEAREDAVLFLAWLGTGEAELHEARLPLAKILCGMELDFPVRAHVDLPARALEEADTLLIAANEHWKKAGKLTPAQFRESFLKREGRLQFNGSTWNLKVDRQTIDILLEFLPWSFGTIKLPWMEGLLLVDW
jgi:hypothetical protein